MTDYLPWIIVAVLAVLLIVALVTLVKEKNKVRLLENNYDSLNRNYNNNLPYYLDPDERLALGTFIGDHLDDRSHPSRDTVVHILAKWGATR